MYLGAHAYHRGELQCTPIHSLVLFIMVSAGPLTVLAGRPPYTAGQLPDMGEQLPDTEGQLTDTSGLPSYTAGQLPDMGEQLSGTGGQLTETSGPPPDISGKLQDTSGNLLDTKGPILVKEGKLAASPCNFDDYTLNCISLNMLEIPENVDGKNVTKLFFSENKLRVIQNNAFREYPSLSILVLDSDEIFKIEVDAFSGLDKLKDLNLRGNEISYLDKNTLKNNSNLVNLILSQNPLTLSRTPVLISYSITYLDMSGCNLTALYAETFSGLTNLHTLILNHNSLTNLSRYLFDYLPNLESLYLRLNEISYVDPNIFNGNKKLTHLILSENLWKLSRTPFLISYSIKTLYMQNCNLTTVYPETFSSLFVLETLSLNNNSMHHLDHLFFATLPVTVKSVDLRNNPWNCDDFPKTLLKSYEHRIAYYMSFYESLCFTLEKPVSPPRTTNEVSVIQIQDSHPKKDETAKPETKIMPNNDTKMNESDSKVDEYQSKSDNGLGLLDKFLNVLSLSVIIVLVLILIGSTIAFCVYLVRYKNSLL